MTAKTALLWFRQDLRLDDNPALLAAAASDYEILPVYILDDESPGAWKMGGASRWWLHKSLVSLNRSLDGHILFYKGNTQAVLSDLIEQQKPEALFCNRCYEPWNRQLEHRLADLFKARGIDAQSFNASLLNEPWEVKKSDGTPYGVYTPYSKAALQRLNDPKRPENAPAHLRFKLVHDRPPLSALNLLGKPAWYKKMEPHWSPGEQGARQKFDRFLQESMKNYAAERDRPDLNSTSSLSPHLHFGEISPRRILWETREHAAAAQAEAGADKFISEILWREFCHHLLHTHPHMPERPLKQNFENISWNRDDAALRRWQKGQTGIPIVDAGMRQLWQTGWMHNRVRMIVASLLVKNMGIDWREGERWFWDCLVDADLANNAAGWQWVAGCGADAAPYFRIFNPVTQAQKFDPEGRYIRKFVPEIAKLDTESLFAPWLASRLDLASAGVVLGETYPHPIIDLAASRQKALEAYARIK
ncbi:MAG: DNA photolyase family protein [Alphaproteobacteria bacterium]|nr:DNA photolyase family protein [Alphaproteobacteria bacterium]